MHSAWPAAAVHVFTALGIVLALLATMAVLDGAWELAFAWLGVALLVDGVDGTLARLADVPSRLPRFSGERLDLVIDYITYVFVPALMLLEGGYLAGTWGLGLACVILLSSLFHFSDTESKAEDHSFIGFPAVWNLVAFYVFAFDLSGIWTGVLVLVCGALTFVPMKWAHPLRTPILFPITLAMMAIWCVAAAAVLWTGFPGGMAVKATLLVTAVYGVGLTLVRWRPA